MNAAEKIRLHYPLPIAKLCETVHLENEPRQRVHKLIDLFESTAQYLVLVGLASCNRYGISDPKLEALRPGLARPSLGHWISLLKALSHALRASDPVFLTTHPGHVFKDDAISKATTTLGAMVALQTPKKVLLRHFLDTLVTFRNKKIGHGTLSLYEAEQVRLVLEEALMQWLAGLVVLYERDLLHIDAVQWHPPHYVYAGTNLNAGTSRTSVHLDGDQPVDPNRVYLRVLADEELIPLHPFFYYDRYIDVLYAYSELSTQEQPVLKCPYEVAGLATTLVLDLDPGIILGSAASPDVELEDQVEEEPEPQAQPIPREEEEIAMKATSNWFDIIPPHEDIRKGHFDEAVFAADLGGVAAGTAPADYNDPYLFYKKTYLTQGLKSLLSRVHNTLATGQGPSVVEIQTPFGGGKTHALVAIYHYLRHGEKVKDLLPQGLELLSPRMSVVAGTHWDPLQGRTSDGLTRHTFWGEIAYQIGGKAGYDAFRDNDQARVSPGKDKLGEFLAAHQPFILLFDEILEYINRALDVRSKGQLDVSLGTQTYSFFQELTETVASLPQGMLVVTLPSSQLEDFSERHEESLTRLSKIFGRVESIETPVQGEEVYSVVRRRLFEEEQLRRVSMRETVYRYFNLYQQHQDDLPPKIRDAKYPEKMQRAYPFHPDLIDILYEKWSTFPTFQRTRGVLRLLANVIEDLYQRELNIDLILPGDINLEQSAVRQEFLRHTGIEYEGVVASDIAGHEAKAQDLDDENRSWKHLAQRIATAIFFHSFSADDSERGINLPYIKLATLRGDTIPALVTEVLGKLSNGLWYLNSRADAYYFSPIPNLNRMILDKKELFNQAYEPKLREIVQDEIGDKFTSYLWPENGEGIPDNRALKLVILRPDDDGSRIPSWLERRGASFREYQNTLFFALTDTAAFARLREAVKTYLALQEIKSEVDAGLSPLPADKQDEIKRRMRDIERDFSDNVRRMYHVLQVGTRKIDLGQPVAGKETLSNWYWRELISGDIGGIITQLHYRMIVNQLMVGNDQVATSLILDQFYKNPELPAPSEFGVVARAIQLAVQDGALGLTEMRDDELDPTTLKYGQDIPLESASFEPGFYLLSQEKAATLKAQIAPPEEPGPPEIAVPGHEVVIPGPTVVTPGPEVVTPTEKRYQRIRLVIGDVPAGKIADVNRGILMPIKSAFGDFDFTLTVDVSDPEGISETALQNTILETVRQIGARIVDETLE